MSLCVCRSEETPALHESRPCWDAEGHWGAANPLRRRYHDEGRPAARATSPSQSGVGFTLTFVINVVLKYCENLLLYGKFNTTQVSLISPKYLMMPLHKSYMSFNCRFLFSMLTFNRLKMCPLLGCVLVKYSMLQYSGALPEADMSDLPWSPAPVHPHLGWCPAHPAHSAAALHCHAGKHPNQTGGMQL